jgi:hypothetical protein
MNDSINTISADRLRKSKSVDEVVRDARITPRRNALSAVAPLLSTKYSQLLAPQKAVVAPPPNPSSEIDNALNEMPPDISTDLDANEQPKTVRK